jgi:hypothetical protein
MFTSVLSHPLPGQSSALFYYLIAFVFWRWSCKHFYCRYCYFRSAFYYLLFLLYFFSFLLFVVVMLVFGFLLFIVGFLVHSHFSCLAFVSYCLLLVRC